jgi:hypothetical protein
MMMPKRRRTRAADRARQRARNARSTRQYIAELAIDYGAERNKPPPIECEETVDIWDISQRSLTCDDDPPPF